MIILIGGSTHTGKTALSQKLIEKYHYPCMSLDHLKMGLIRSKRTNLTPMDDDQMIDLLWPIVKEMVKTAIENHQNMIIEGCYFPYDWKQYFTPEYLVHIRLFFLVMTTEYIQKHFIEIKKYASVIEDRGEDEDCREELLIRDNEECLKQCLQYKCNYVLIQDTYDIDEEVERIL